MYFLSWTIAILLVVALAGYFYFINPKWEKFQMNQGVIGNNFKALCKSDADCVPFFKCHVDGDVKRCS